MGPRYTKAIIMMVVGFPVLVAGFIIDNSIDNETGRSSTVTIARLMIAAGAIMVAIGVFFCCTVTLTKKDDRRSSRPRLTNYVSEPPKASTPSQSQPQQPEQFPPGVQMVTYSTTPGAHNKAFPLRAQQSGAHTINSPSAPMQTVFVPATIGGQNIDQYPSNSVSPNSSQYSNAVTIQNIGQYPSTSVAMNIGEHPTTITQNPTYSVTAEDMKNFLNAAKKVLDSKSFEELTHTCPIVYSVTQGEQVPYPTGDHVASCPPLSADQVSKPTDPSKRYSQIKDQPSPEGSVPVSDTPSAPLFQEPPPEVEPPPYCP